MKRYLLLSLSLMSLIFIVGCKHEKVAVTNNEATIEFEETTYDCQQVKIGDKTTHRFVFHNVGNTPLIINKVGGTCGCITGEAPKHPIAPGEQGEVKVVYDSEGEYPSHFSKSVVVVSNSTTGTVVLHMKGEQLTSLSK